ncbi:ABC transporter ATP-binding protein [Naumannella sp. ID2617S]|nr:ABC transporter ATP-binding protein [Naumannella sp. ID2617S]
MSTDNAGSAPVRRAPERPKHAPTGPQLGGPHGPRPVEKASTFGPSLKRLVGRLRPERPLVILVLVLAATGVAMGVVGPKILGMATDVVFAGVLGTMMATMAPGASKEQIVAGLRARGDQTTADLLQHSTAVPGVGIDFTRLGWIVLLALGLYVFSSLLLWLQAYLLNGVVNRTVQRMRRDVAAKLNRLPLRYFDNQPRGELLSRVTNDIDNITQSMQQTLSQLVNSLLTLIGVLLMMLLVSPLLTLVALVTIPISMVLTMAIGKRSQKLFKQTWKSTGELNAHVEEAYTGHALVKVFGRQREVQQVFDRRNCELYQASFGSQFVSGIIMPAMMFIGNLNYVVIAVIGGLRVTSGAMTLGDVQAFIQYSRQFTQPLTQVASMANLLQSGVASAERVFEVLDEAEEVPEGGIELEPARGHVRFEHVDFAYTPQRPLITDLSLDVRPGATVAIVGPTGAGKTTLVNLVMRFYELDAGRITLDGVDISTVPRSALRSKIGMVLQDTWLFGGTIRENIAYGRPGASEEEIIAAARATYVDRFVHSLPDGYDTVIDEEGAGVSAGEKQLITIARAFLADPALLILDEATSSVDTRTEALVQQAMAALRRRGDQGAAGSNRTSFVIAHRLSTIRDADTILVMENGGIVEQGSHAELLTADGAYARLYRSQFAAPVELVD